MDAEIFKKIAKTGVYEEPDNGIPPYWHYVSPYAPQRPCRCGSRSFYRYGNTWRCSYSVLPLTNLDEIKRMD